MKEDLISSEKPQGASAINSCRDATCRNFRVAVMQRMICHYQMPYFFKLKKDLKEISIDLKVFCGITESKGYPSDDSLFERLPYLKFNISIGGLQEKLILLPFLFWSLLKYKPDVIVAEDISAMPNCLTIYFYSKIFGVPYIVWGPGSIPQKKPSRIRGFMEPLISLYRKGSNGFLCYSSYAKDYYSRKYNKDCYVVYNSTTLPHSESEHNKITSNIYRKYNDMSRLNIVFIGRLLPQKKVELLLSAVSMIDKNIPVSVNIIGDGNMKQELIGLSKEMKLEDRINFLGTIIDRDKKADIFMQAHLGVLPGLGGLAIQEMMWYGIPVITSYADGTERDLVLNGESGFFVEQMTAENLYKSIMSFINLENDKKIAISLNGLKIINDKYNINSMVNSFKTSIWSIKKNHEN